MQNLRLRSRGLDLIRKYFLSHGFLEVETPYLQEAPNLDPYVEPFPLDGGLFLHTSPEYQMKRVLAAGAGDIFQICRVFRKDPQTPWHRREFTMLEWYRPDRDYLVLMEDVRGLVMHLVKELGLRSFLRSMEGAEINLEGPWLSLPISEAFREFAGIDPLDMDESRLRDYLMSEGFKISAQDSWETCFHHLFVAQVEPALAKMDKPVFLCHYPASLSVMARLSPQDPRVCERLELYIGGVELMNGYSELTQPKEQRHRLKAERKARKVSWPLDDGLLEALASMPPAAGAAMGLDRLLTVLTGERDIGGFLLE